jgi:hypothetical protein
MKNLEVVRQGLSASVFLACGRLKHEAEESLDDRLVDQEHLHLHSAKRLILPTNHT